MEDGVLEYEDQLEAEGFALKTKENLNVPKELLTRKEALIEASNVVFNANSLLVQKPFNSSKCLHEERDQ